MKEKEIALRRGSRVDRSLGDGARRASASARTISQNVLVGDRQVRPI